MARESSVICPNPKCRHDITRILETEQTKTTIRRRRICYKCKNIWSTVEVDVVTAKAVRDIERMVGVLKKLMDRLHIEE